MRYKLKRIIRLLLRLNWIQTARINLKMFPFKVAIKTPIYIYGKAKFRELKGKIIINVPITRGMIKIGKNDYYVRTSVPLTYWVLNGTIVFNGSMRFMNGGYLCISRNATLSFGKEGLIGSNYKIMCFENINFGQNFSCSYDCQIYDTSFHYTQKSDGSVEKLTSPVIVGDYVWVGNSSTIAKGAVIPKYAVIANRSLVNKDFSSAVEEGQGCLLAGSPAKIKSIGIKRIFDNDLEKQYDRLFGYDRTTHL